MRQLNRPAIAALDLLSKVHVEGGGIAVCDSQGFDVRFIGDCPDRIRIKVIVSLPTRGK